MPVLNVGGTYLSSHLAQAVLVLVVLVDDLFDLLLKLVYLLHLAVEKFLLLHFDFEIIQIESLFCKALQHFLIFRFFFCFIDFVIDFRLHFSL